MSRPTVCIYLTGSPADSVRAAHGSFVDWFCRLLAPHPVDTRVCDGTTGNLPDDLDTLAGIIITGSPASLTRPEPWMESSIELIRDAFHRRLPTLGVCFGLQLMGAAFGGSVVQNPAGWQVATRPVAVNPRGRRDALFDGMPDPFPAQLCHQDIVLADTLSPMNGIDILAATPKAPVSAVACGPVLRGVQFHPEFLAAITRAYIDIRREILAEEATRAGKPDEHPDALLPHVRDCPEAETVVHNFVRHFVLRPHAGA